MFQFGVLRRILVMALALGAASTARAAEDGTWSVGKSSGEVWIATTGAQQASLKPEEILKPGDTIRTGRNGRVLLVRGDETILISPNSVVGLPAEKKEGLSTTIVQRAGSILLEVEKRNVKHFEVETPYLAAVVKGTQFSVTVDAASTSVQVNRGQVEVLDFKSGQIAKVMPGQAATAFAHGKSGLSLSGSGTFNPIEQGKPRASSIERVPVPKSGLSAPRNAANGSFIDTPVRPKGLRISAALGEVKLNVAKVTHGLAHSAAAPGVAKRDSSKDTAWSDAKANSGAASSSGVASTVAAVTGVANPSGNGNGNAANGNGNNGNGNGGVGNGHGKGNAKH